MPFVQYIEFEVYFFILFTRSRVSVAFLATITMLHRHSKGVLTFRQSRFVPNFTRSRKHNLTQCDRWNEKLERKAPRLSRVDFTSVETKYGAFRSIRHVASNFFIFFSWLPRMSKKRSKSDGTISYIPSTFFFFYWELPSDHYSWYNVRAADSVKLREKLFKYLNSTFYLKTSRRWTEKSLLGKFLQPHIPTFDRGN